MTVTYRKAIADDNYTTFSIFHRSLLDFSLRSGVLGITGGQDPAQLALTWERRRSLWNHLAMTADQYWIAEENGEGIGYARSILRGEVRELTEFFVLPEHQTAGVGRELIRLAFPAEGSQQRVIVATSDFRALARYMKAGVYPYVTQIYVERAPEPVKVETDLSIDPMDSKQSALRELGEIDAAILGHRRDVDHEWLMKDRTGYFYKRRGKVAGYGYIHADFYGPFALLEDRDFPAVLAHAETQAHALGSDRVGFEVPLINRAALNHLLRRGYQLEGFLGSIMSDAPFGRFENYLLTSPPYFL